MISSAKRLKDLAADTAQLADKVGAVAYVIIKDSFSRKKIVAIKNQDLEEDPKSNWRKVQAFIKKMSSKVDTKLYGEMYKTAAAKLGHQDANNLIEKWLNQKIVDNGKEKFVADSSECVMFDHQGKEWVPKQAFKPAAQANDREPTPAKPKRDGCCQIF